LPIVITLENSETEVVALKIQHEISESEESPSDHAEFPFLWETSPGETISEKELDIGDVNPGEQRVCTIIFNAPSVPTECSLNLLIKYFLHSDLKTEVIKRALLDVPVIQPFQATFEIIPRLEETGLPDLFSERGELCVSQMWRLNTALSRIGGDVLELRDIKVIDPSKTPGVSLKTVQAEKEELSGMLSNVGAEM